MKKRIFLLISALVSLILSSITYSKGADKISMTIVYDNYICQENTISDWGFSCFIKGTEKTILFDTGNNGSILLRNIDSLEIDLSGLDLIIISHNHGDHTRGLNSILGRKSDIPVYFGNSFPSSFSQNISNKSAIPIRVNESIKICEHVFSTGELPGPVNEQSLIIDTENGLVIITGCSHPGIINILKRSQEILNKNIYLVFGGFHLLNHSDAQISNIIQEFKALGVEKCGATHCTGDRAIALFKEAYGENYVSMGVGQVIQGSIKPTKIKESDNGESFIPSGFNLGQNYPNPFNSSTIIQYTIHKAGPIRLKIFDLSGQEIETLINIYQTSGEYTKIWRPEGLSSGLYFCRLQVGNFSETKKLILQK